MVGPQKDRSSEIYLQGVSFTRKAKKSAVSESIVGKSVCPPSLGSTKVCLWSLMLAGQSSEFPRPVPGPKIPRILFSWVGTPLREIKSSFSRARSPQEAASKSLMKRKEGMLSSLASSSPTRVPHLGTLARETVFSKMCPAMPMTATEGSWGRPSRKELMDWAKSSWSATLRLLFLSVEMGPLLEALSSTSSRRMLVPPTSPSKAQLVPSSAISISKIYQIDPSIRNSSPQSNNKIKQSPQFTVTSIHFLNHS